MNYTSAGGGIAAGGGVPAMMGAPIGFIVLFAALTAVLFAIYRFIPKRASN